MSGWNHNIHYHEIVLAAVPLNCGRALDVGCGTGLPARRLTGRCVEVIAIDTESFDDSASSVTYIQGDVMTYPFCDESFDFITAVATLHHLPLEPALARFERLLRPGGILAIIGLYRAASFQDYALAAAAVPVSRMLRCLHGHAEVGAPLHESRETITEIRTACHAILPGGVFRRRLLFRYSFVRRKFAAGVADYAAPATALVRASCANR